MSTFDRHFRPPDDDDDDDMDEVNNLSGTPVLVHDDPGPPPMPMHQAGGQVVPGNTDVGEDPFSSRPCSADPKKLLYMTSLFDEETIEEPVRKHQRREQSPSAFVPSVLSFCQQPPETFHTIGRAAVAMPPKCASPLVLRVHSQKTVGGAPMKQPVSCIVS